MEASLPGGAHLTSTLYSEGKEGPCIMPITKRSVASAMGWMAAMVGVSRHSMPDTPMLTAMVSRAPTISLMRPPVHTKDYMKAVYHTHLHYCGG